MSQDILNPATEEVLETIELADSAEVDCAVHRAKQAQKRWQAISPGDRSRLLRRFARLLGDHAEEIGTLEMLDCGKPRVDANGEAREAADVFDYYSSAPERVVGQQIPVSGGISVTFQEPVGVVGIIVPWNYPLLIGVWGAAPALGAGNAVVVKASELAPLSLRRIAELGLDAGFPEGLFQVVVGLGETAGERLVEHPDVAKIVFTGSTDVGRRVASLAGSLLKPVTLELGGKSANLIFADADLEAAAKAAPKAVFKNAGQDCCARSRIAVQAEAYDEFMQHLERAVAGLRVGLPTDPETQVGPVISQRQLERIRSYLDDDSIVLAQSSAPTGPGFWFPPTVLEPKHPAARVLNEEVFGPVVTVSTFATEHEAVTFANATQFGLSGSIWTSSLERAIRVSRAVESGTLSVNSNNAVRYSTPFGGVKNSGVGRELGPDAPLAFTQSKTVFYAAASA